MYFLNLLNLILMLFAETFRLDRMHIFHLLAPCRIATKKYVNVFNNFRFCDLILSCMG